MVKPLLLTGAATVRDNRFPDYPPPLPETNPGEDYRIAGLAGIITYSRGSLPTQFYGTVPPNLVDPPGIEPGSETPFNKTLSQA